MEGDSARRGSEASSADDSDFYSPDAPPSAAACLGQPSQEEDAERATTLREPSRATNEGYEGSDDDDDNSSQAMDISRDATPEPENASANAMASVAATATATATAAPVEVAAAMNRTGTKRKLDDLLDANSAAADESSGDVKRSKDGKSPLEKEKPELTGPIWQHVFLYLSPPMLCRCLRVCKDFQHYLTKVKTDNKQPEEGLVNSEFIWTQSRTNHFRQLPKPLACFADHPLPELEMFKLLGGHCCEFCGTPGAAISTTSHLAAGPSQNGVRVMFPFGIRSCGACIEQRSIKDIDTMSLGLNPKLRLGITHGFLSPYFNFGTESLRQLPGGIPGHLRFSKIYYRPHWESICQEQQTVHQDYGDATTEEWLKGLEARGRQAMADSARWERWELQLSPGANLAQTLREYDLDSFPHSLGKKQNQPVGVIGAQPSAAQPSTAANGTHPLPQPVHVFPNGNPSAFPPNQQQLVSQSHTKPSNPQEVEMVRQARKAEIERRCREDIVPALEPDLLPHMDSFRNTMQIARPLADAEWAMLKPKLLSQRSDAELIEHERRTQLAILQASMPSLAPTNTDLKSSRDANNSEYEAAQRPIRQLIGEFADNIINGEWRGGQLVSAENAHIFAIRVLLGVYHRFKQAGQDGSLASLPAPPSSDEDMGSQPRPFLSLDNMKWVFDHKIRPWTEPYAQNLFLCAGEGCLGVSKAKSFPFEGLIQHYGAKHTDDFSRENVVVHWRDAEWPESPPFDEHPDRQSGGKQKQKQNQNHNHNHNHNQEQNHRQRNASQKSHATTASSNSHAQSRLGRSTPLPAPAPMSLPSATSAHPHAASNGHPHAHYAFNSNGATVDRGAQISQLFNDAKELWDALDGIKDLETGVRVQTVMVRTLIRSIEQYGQHLQLDDLTNALASQPNMRQLKNAKGLVCKACAARNPSGTYWSRYRRAEKHSFSELIRHFQLMHQPDDQGRFLDWTKDMIEVPEDTIMRQLLQAPGMDDVKLALIASAFPSAFPQPLPRIGTVTEESVPDGAEDKNSVLRHLNKKPKQGKKKGNKGNKRSNSAPGRDDSQEPLPQPTEDEYDPRRPMFVGVKKEVDPSLYDTDARLPSASLPQPLATGGMAYDSSTETLQGLLAQAQRPVQPRDLQSRSPSVGREAAPPPASTNGAGMTSTGQPDIAAILASLTGQAQATQTSAPPDANRSGSATHRGYHVDEKPRYEQSLNYQGVPSQNHWYEPSQQPAPVGQELRDLQDLQAALSQNSRHFGQNQQPALADAPSYGASTGYPAPSYHGYDHNQQRAQPPLHRPVYREQTVPYANAPARDHEYAYEHAAPRPIFIDQYGQQVELIPVEATPAPAPLLHSQHAQPQYIRPEQYQQHVYTSVPPSGQLRPVYDEQRPFYPPPRYPYDQGRP